MAGFFRVALRVGLCVLIGAGVVVFGQGCGAGEQAGVVLPDTTGDTGSPADVRGDAEEASPDTVGPAPDTAEAADSGAVGPTDTGPPDDAGGEVDVSATDVTVGDVGSDAEMADAEMADAEMADAEMADAGGPDDAASDGGVVDSGAPILDIGEVTDFGPSVPDGGGDAALDAEPGVDLPSLSDAGGADDVGGGDDVMDVGSQADAGGECLPAPLVPEPGTDFVVTIGKKSVGTGFGALEPYGDVEIVQGSQGGLHMEVAFRLDLPAPLTASKVFSSVDAVSIQPCCGEAAATVGSFFNKKYLLFPTPDDASVLTSEVIPVIFDGNLASAYVDQEICVRIVVSFDDPSSPGTPLSGAGTIPLHTVDWF